MTRSLIFCLLILAVACGQAFAEIKVLRDSIGCDANGDNCTSTLTTLRESNLGFVADETSDEPVQQRAASRSRLAVPPHHEPHSVSSSSFEPHQRESVRQDAFAELGLKDPASLRFEDL